MSTTRKTFGSLNAGDLTRQATVDDAGFKVTGTIESVWHRTNHKGEPLAMLTLVASGDAEFKLTRPAHTEIDVEDTDA